VAKGSKGRQSDVAAQAGLLFQLTTPRLACCNDFKDATKAARPSSTSLVLLPILLRPSELPPATSWRAHGITITYWPNEFNGLAMGWWEIGGWPRGCKDRSTTRDSRKPIGPWQQTIHGCMVSKVSLNPRGAGEPWAAWVEGMLSRFCIAGNGVGHSPCLPTLELHKLCPVLEARGP
jgi:hypothetical protein